MLEYQKRLLLEKYKNYTLKVEPFVLNSAGYKPQETLIKIGEHVIFCTPVTISLEKCTVLLSLNNEEYKFFKEMEKSLISINFAFGDVYFDSHVSFYTRGLFNELKKIRDNVYFLYFIPKSISDTYEEIFFFMSEMLEKYKEIFNNDPKIIFEECVTEKTFNLIGVYQNGVLLGNGKVTSIAVNRVDINILNKLDRVTEGKTYDLYTNFYNKRLKLSGKLISKSDGQCSFEIAYRTEYVYILSKFLDDTQSKDENEEDIDEL